MDFIEFEPHRLKTPRSKVVNPEQWAQHRDFIEEMYMKQKFSREVVLQLLETRDFYPSPRQLQTKFQEWKMLKNAPKRKTTTSISTTHSARVEVEHADLRQRANKEDVSQSTADKLLDDIPYRSAYGLDPIQLIRDNAEMSGYPFTAAIVPESEEDRIVEYPDMVVPKDRSEHTVQYFTDTEDETPQEQTPQLWNTPMSELSGTLSGLASGISLHEIDVSTIGSSVIMADDFDFEDFESLLTSDWLPQGEYPRHA